MGNSTVDRRDFRFFCANAGGIVGRRAEGALELARAEDYAEDAGWEFEWEFDEVFYGYCDEWLGCPKDCEKNHEVLCCCLKDANGEVLGSLCGIADADRNYIRVVEAELALEAISELPKATFGIGKAA